MSGATSLAVSALVVNRNTRLHLRHGLERLLAIAEAWRHGDRGRTAESAGRSSGAVPLGLEAIVVDNASDDGSRTSVEEFETSTGGVLPIQLIASECNLGFGAACNLAARKARGRYLLFVNPDAWIDEASLLRLVQALEADSELAVAAPRLRYPNGSPQFVWSPPTGVVGEAVQKLRNGFEGAACNHELLPRLLRPLLGAGWFSAACLLIRRDAFEAVGGFDEGYFLYFEDADLGLRIHRSGWRQRQIPGAEAWHVRGGATSGADLARGNGPGGLAATRPGALPPEIAWFYRASQLRYYDRHRPAWECVWLRRRLRRKFGALEDERERRTMLQLLEEGRT